jgi:sugar lactone lactonase YvrE
LAARAKESAAGSARADYSGLLRGAGSAALVISDLVTPTGRAFSPAETKLYVVEGRGSTEVWQDKDSNKKQSFEWGPGSLFGIPLNAWHRVVNAAGAISSRSEPGAEPERKRHPEGGEKGSSALFHHR